MVALFPDGPDFIVKGRDGLNWTVLAYKDVVLDDGTKYRVPIGCSTDGASTPRFLWSIGIPPFGSYWAACVVHDAYFRGLLLIWSGADWVPLPPSQDTEERANDLLRALMICLGVDETIREEIYLGVKLGGFAAWRKDRLNTMTIPPVGVPGPPAHAPA